MNTIPLQKGFPQQMAEKETIGQCVQRRRIDLGMTRPNLAAKAARFGKVSESFVRDLELDRFPSPGIKGLEAVARALEMSPLDLIALGLHEEHVAAERKSERAFEKSRFVRLWRAYGRTESKRLRALVEDTVEMLIDRLNKG